MNSKLKRDDTIQVVTGKDRGKTGKILRVNSHNGTVIVQGLNIVRKAVRQKRQNEKGGIIDIEAPIDMSNVMIVCRKCGPTKIGISMEKNEKKGRKYE